MFRWFALAILLAAMTISTFHRRRARMHGEVIPRSRESRPLIAGRLLIALPLFGSVIAYIVAPGSMAWSAFQANSGLRWLGVALGVTGVFNVHWVLKTLGRNVSETVLTRQSQQLVTSGPYRWVRHPLYTTGSALFIALALMAANWFILAFALLALIAIRFIVVPLEEKALLARFGADYQNYMRGTGAMLPRLRDPAPRARSSMMDR